MSDLERVLRAGYVIRLTQGEGGISAVAERMAGVGLAALSVAERITGYGHDLDECLGNLLDNLEAKEVSA